VVTTWWTVIPSSGILWMRSTAAASSPSRGSVSYLSGLSASEKGVLLQQLNPAPIRTPGVPFLLGHVDVVPPRPSWRWKVNTLVIAPLDYLNLAL
jgi:hypothetical protein